ncbi:uncharacterized protein VTP21DRAFT_4436 [Calcarisporiella thermophila]|uniref:uncharacterized protein n=1 Tax=Calcarisporiella thermophila TaxID=911321 RepID=UPI0037447EA2
MFTDYLQLSSDPLEITEYVDDDLRRTDTSTNSSEIETLLQRLYIQADLHNIAGCCEAHKVLCVANQGLLGLLASQMLQINAITDTKLQELLSHIVDKYSLFLSSASSDNQIHQDECSTCAAEYDNDPSNQDVHFLSVKGNHREVIEFFLQYSIPLFAWLDLMQDLEKQIDEDEKLADSQANVNSQQANSLSSVPDLFQHN